MKRIISIILIAGISFSSFHLDELTKLRTLGFHYLEHKQTHPETTVYSFLYDHYVTNKKADSARDKERNSQLPFKSTQNIHSHISFAIFSEVSVLLNSISIAFVPVPLNLLNYSKSPLAIWQPPKLS